MAKFFSAKGKKNTDKTFSLVIEKFSLDGKGIGYFQDSTVFVEGGLVGEKVEVKGAPKRGKATQANLLRVLSPSPIRQDESCAYARQCGGCSQQHIPHQAQVSLKQQAFFDYLEHHLKHKVDVAPAVTSPDWGYRRRARIGVSVNKRKELVLGFRRKRSNELVNIDACPVIASPFGENLGRIRTLLMNLSRKDAISHIEICVAKPRPHLLLRQVKPLTDADMSRLRSFGDELDWQIWCKQDEGDALAISHANPDSAPYYQLEDLELYFDIQGFIQVNPLVNERMITQAVEWLALDKNDQVLDLFCGMGNFSLPMATKVKRVSGVEGVDSLVAQAKHNASHNGLENVSFFRGDLHLDIQQQAWFEGHNKLLLDPARAGAAQVVAQLKPGQFEKILYVSCNPATFVEDARVLKDKGYRLQKAGILDMFPHTSHVESMALFSPE